MPEPVGLVVRPKLVARRIVNRRLVMVPLIAAAVLGLASCSPSTGGNATPGTTSSSPPAPTGGASTTSLQPCDLISSADASGLQLTQQGGPVTALGARSCTWSKPVDINGQNGYTLGIDIRDSQSVSSFNRGGFTLTQDNIGSHQGIQAVANGGGGCSVVIGVGSTSRVDVVVSMTDTTAACQFVNQIAKIVEPRLPGGS